MSEPPVHLHDFEGTAGRVRVALPFELEDVLADWSALRVAMTRELPEAFRRDEWAYLIAFLERGSLLEPFRLAFGTPAASGTTGAGARHLARPGGPVAVWLPNNVSLLGPLAIVLLSLTGNELFLKGGASSEDLGGDFLAFAREHLRAGPLAEHLAARVRHARFDRDDPRNAQYAAAARVRIVFGSDGAAEAVEALAHPVGSRTVAFVDRASEAWIGPGRADDATLETLARVFAVYGQAGCTSPRRVVLVDQEPAAAGRVRERLRELWPRAAAASVEANVASGNVMARQWAAALGWDAVLTPGHAAVLASREGVGDPGAGAPDAPLVLPIVAAPLERAVAELPANVQTIGHALEDADAERWWRLLATGGVKRFVPLARMHHFGARWDGEDFWRATFEHVEVAP